MQKDIHPKMNHVIFRDVAAKTEFKAMSTATSKETETIDGVEYFVIQLDVSSASHPFFTGKQNLVDTSGRVERFKKQMAKAAA